MPDSFTDVVPKESNTKPAPAASSTSSETRGDSSRSRFGWIVPAFLILIFTAQCLWFVNTQSLSNDEPLHIIAGLDAWRLHRFERWNDHPPIVFLIGTLPLLLNGGDIDIREDAKYADGIRPSPEAVAWAGRITNVLFGAFFGLLFWLTARRLFSEDAANFALALFALSPSLIANFSIACNDGVLALVVFGSALMLAHWRKHQTWGRTIALAVMLGLLLATKFSTPALFVLALGLILILKPETIEFRPLQWNWRQAFAILAISFLTVWGVFFFHSTKVTIKNNMVTTSSPNRTKPATGALHVPLNITFYIPAGEYLEGMGRVANHLKLGHPSYLLGEVKKSGGWKTYFPTVVALKWPPVVLGLFLVTLTHAAMRKIRFNKEVLLLLTFPTFYFLMAIFSKVDLGERHILLVYPFALLCIAALWQFTQKNRAILYLFLALLAINAADTLRYAPDYLSYFTPFVNPATSYKLLSDSNVDWGQGLIALRNYQQQHPDEDIHLAYFGTIDPKLYGIRYTPLEPDVPATGTIVVSATHLTGQLLDDPNGYHWALKYPETAILNHSLHVFKVPALPQQSSRN
jgi:4-amino-4-deoxy-L-arabinose transferase-like glycosyltransferase